MNSLRTALILSLVVNVFLGFALAAGYATLRVDRHVIDAGSLRVAGSELPPAERRAFRHALRQTRRAMRPEIVASRRAKAEAAALLEAPTMDPAAVDAALDRARADDMAVRAAVEHRAVRYAAGLPLPARQSLADAMKKRQAMRGHRGVRKIAGRE